MPEGTLENHLQYSTNIIRVIISTRMRWKRNVGRMGERRVAYRVLVGKPEGKRPFGRPWCRWGDYIKMDHSESGGMGRI
jgi:hypothetical protein